MSKKLITAKEIVKKYALTFQTVNHYTNFGLFSVVTKKGNVRMYDQSEIKQRMRSILRMVSEGYSLRLIRKKLIGV